MRKKIPALAEIPKIIRGLKPRFFVSRLHGLKAVANQYNSGRVSYDNIGNGVPFAGMTI